MGGLLSQVHQAVHYKDSKLPADAGGNASTSTLQNGKGHALAYKPRIELCGTESAMHTAAEHLVLLP